MASVTRIIAPSNAMFFIEGSGDVVPPAPSTERIKIISNGLSILVPCQPDVDGDTVLTVASVGDLTFAGTPRFQDYVETPDYVLLFHDVGLTELIRYPVKTQRTLVQIWTDRTDFPTRIDVVVE